MNWSLIGLRPNYALERSVTCGSERVAGARTIVAPAAPSSVVPLPTQFRR